MMLQSLWISILINLPLPKPANLASAELSRSPFPVPRKFGGAFRGEQFSLAVSLGGPRAS